MKNLGNMDKSLKFVIVIHKINLSLNNASQFDNVNYFQQYSNCYKNSLKLNKI